MENTPGTGVFLSPEELAHVLRDAADEIDNPRGHGPGSYEGSITWETPFPGTEQTQGKFEVIAVYRVGNDDGQGGMVFMRGDDGVAQ